MDDTVSRHRARLKRGRRYGRGAKRALAPADRVPSRGERSAESGSWLSFVINQPAGMLTFITQCSCSLACAPDIHSWNCELREELCRVISVLPGSLTITGAGYSRSEARIALQIRTVVSQSKRL